MTKKDKRKKISDNENAKRDYHKNKKHFGVQDLQHVDPLTKAQEQLLEENTKDQNMFLHGSAGTGKTYMGMYVSLLDVLDKNTPYDKLIIVRSAVPTRDIGFLPGELNEKVSIYEQPYRAICNELFEYNNSYDNLKKGNYIEFTVTSFIRGMTLNNCVVLVDEIQNMSFHELDSVITRIGYNAKIIFSGDISQSDLTKQSEKEGLKQFMSVTKNLKQFSFINFTASDIIRSGLVKDYIIAKEKAGF